MAIDGEQVPPCPPAPGPASPTPEPGRSSRADRWLVLAILLLPAVFFDWALPFVSDTTLGNDYSAFSLPQQLELRFSIAKGSFPLFVPGFAGGQTAQAMVQGQAYHPVSILASHLPGYWSGHALEINTLLRLLSLGLAHLALFVLLRRLGLGRAAAFLVGMVTTYNLRMLDLFRYGAALESWTGHLFLCAFVGLTYLRPSSLGARAGLIAATYWLVTSGHPQMAYYGLLAAGLFTLLLPFIAAAVAGRARESWSGFVRFWLRAGMLVALGLFLSGNFIVPFATEFLARSSRSATSHDIAWTLSWLDTGMGILSNLFLPLRADVHGAFGGSALVLLAALAPLLWLARVRVPVAVLAAWGLAGLVVLALLGERTPVYPWLWRHLPFLGVMRTPGRLALLLPVLLMSVLAWLFAEARRRAEAPRGRRRFTLVLGGAGLLASAIYLGLCFGTPPSASEYRPVLFNQVSRATETAMAVLGILTLVGFALLLGSRRWHRGLLVAVCVLAGIESKLVLAHGTWREAPGPTPTFAEWAAWKRHTLDYRFPSGDGSFDPTMWRQASLFHVEPTLARVYFQWRGARDVEDAYRILGEGVSPQEVVVEEGGEGARPPPVPADRHAAARVRLVFSSLNRLVFEVDATDAGYFTLAYPFTGRWRASVGGVAIRPRRANGGHHAIPIPAGHSRVEVEYHSAGQLVGWGLSAVALVLATFVLVAPGVGRRRALGCAAVVAVAASALVMLLVRSLHAGQSYGTTYAWSGPEPPGPLPNLAYGRRTTMSSTFNLRHHCCPFVGSKGTDGDRSGKSGFMTDEEAAPRWGVDLGQEREIGKVVAYQSRHGQGWNASPLVIAVSRDGRTWTRAGAILSEQPGVHGVDFIPAVVARYVVLRASGACRLSLDEVELFPPGL